MSLNATNSIAARKSGISLLKHKFSFSFYQGPLDISSANPSFKSVDLRITKTSNPKPIPPTTQKDLVFGDKSTDHMLEIDWSLEGGWTRPRIDPFHNLQIHPFNSALHYAIQCFEGLKAYRNVNGDLHMFRPECNMHRLKITSKALCLPDFDGQEFLDCIKELVKVEKEWVPIGRGFGLYIRPLHIATEPTLGVKEAKSSKLLAMVNPVGPYYEEGFEPIGLLIETKKIRSAPGGYGFYKMGSNYGPTMAASTNAKKHNFSQCLWTFEGEIVEVGSSNIFFLLEGKDGVKQLHTPHLDSGMILPGVTRDTVIQLTKNKPGYRVIERKMYIKQIIDAIENNTLLEMFSTGTAVIVCPVKEIGYEGRTYKIPINHKKKAGDLAYDLFNEILDIQHGVKPHPWSIKIN